MKEWTEDEHVVWVIEPGPHTWKILVIYIVLFWLFVPPFSWGQGFQQSRADRILERLLIR